MQKERNHEEENLKENAKQVKKIDMSNLKGKAGLENRNVNFKICKGENAKQV